MAISDEQWKETRTKVEDWEKDHPDLDKEQKSELKVVHKWLDKGDRMSTRRNRLTTSIKEVFEVLPDSPFVTVNIPTGLTAEMIASREAIITDIKAERTRSWENNVSVKIVETASGRSDGGWFDSGSKFSQRDETAIRNALNAQFRGHNAEPMTGDAYGRCWDGTYEPESEDWSWVVAFTQIPLEDRPKKPKKKAKKSSN